MSNDGPTGPDRAPDGNAGASRSPAGGTPDKPAPAHSSFAADESAGNPRRTDADEQSTWRLFARDLVTSALAVMLVGAYLFAISGVWPPLVAVESGSMVPNMEINDLVFVMDEERFPGEGAVGSTGVVTAASGSSTGYTQFNSPGDVIVFAPDGSSGETPIIHRAMFYVEKDEHWVQRTDPEYRGTVDSCDDVPTCPAEHAGFITKGDGNEGYDQLRSLRSCEEVCEPIKSEWVVGTAQLRIPGLGYLRLQT